MTADRTRHRAGSPVQPSTRRAVPWRPLSVRSRILTAVLVTTALGMLGAGGVSYLIAREQTLDNIRSSLLQENEEINTVAALAGRGETGRTITGPGDVLWLAIKSSVPDPDEAIIGLVDGKVEWVPELGGAEPEVPGGRPGADRRRGGGAPRPAGGAATDLDRGSSRHRLHVHPRPGEGFPRSRPLRRRRRRPARVPADHPHPPDLRGRRVGGAGRDRHRRLPGGRQAACPRCGRCVTRRNGSPRPI